MPENISDSLTPLKSAQQGHLVSQILETQKEFEDTTLSVFDTSNSLVKVDIVSNHISYSRTRNLIYLNTCELKKLVLQDWKEGRHREQEIVTREVDRLRSAIQSLTRAANPLGKLIDFLQEDVDSMHTELEMWHTTNSQLAIQLTTEHR